MSLKTNLVKGPTVTPAVFPVPDQFGQPVLIGFSGMSELDYVATHLLAAMITRVGYSDENELVDSALMMALRLLAKSNMIAQSRQKPEPEEEQPKSNIITG
jgi:hypothetical protein